MSAGLAWMARRVGVFCRWALITALITAITMETTTATAAPATVHRFATDLELEVYAQPVAQELVAALTRLAVDAAVAPRTDGTAAWQVEGSLRSSGERVVLQVRAQHPAGGDAVEPAPRTLALDDLEVELGRVAAELAPRLRAALEPVAAPTPTTLTRPTGTPPRPRVAQPALLDLELSVRFARGGDFGGLSLTALEAAMQTELARQAALTGGQIGPAPAPSAQPIPRAKRTVIVELREVRRRRTKTPSGSAQVTVWFLEAGAVLGEARFGTEHLTTADGGRDAQLALMLGNRIATGVLARCATWCPPRGTWR